MSHDAINSWVEKAKMTDTTEAASEGVRVIKNSHTKQTMGGLIMEIAERLRPGLMKMFEGVRDENGMLVQPARIRGIALNVAQRLVREHTNKTA